VPVTACTNRIADAMFRAPKGLDLGCVAGLRPAPFKLPPGAQACVIIFSRIAGEKALQDTMESDRL